MFTSGIYQIRNTVNDKIYIGQSIKIEERWISHLRSLRKGSHANKALLADYIQYGEDSFVVEILEQCDPLLLHRRESWFCYENDVWNPNIGYNKTKMLDYRRLSSEQAVYYKDLILDFMYRHFRTLFYLTKDIYFEMKSSDMLLGLDHEQAAIALKEITNEDEKKLGSYITLNTKYEKFHLSFYVRENRAFKLHKVVWINAKDDLQKTYYQYQNLFEKYDLIDTTKLGVSINSLLEKETLTKKEKNLLLKSESLLFEQYRDNLENVLSRTKLREPIKTYFINVFVKGNNDQKLSTEELQSIDFLEDSIESFLYENNNQALIEFLLQLHYNPLFDSLKEQEQKR